MCTVAIYVLEPGAFNSGSQYFIPLFNRISWLCVQHPTGDEASNGGGVLGMTLKITLIYIYILLQLESDPSQTVRTGPVFKSDAR